MRIAIALLTLSGLAHAGVVRGTVTLPPEARTTDAREGHWRVENGLLPIQPRWPDPRTEIVVLLEPENAPAPSEKREEAKAPAVTVELHGLRLDPRIALVPLGATVTFKNADRTPHTLYFENARELLQPESTPAGQSRLVRPAAPGEYLVRDEEFPHIEGTLLVLDGGNGGRAAVVDDKGGFKLEAPEGKYTLKVYFHGWVLAQPVEVSGKSTEVALQVPAPAAHATKGRAE